MRTRGAWLGVDKTVEGEKQGRVERYMRERIVTE